MYAGAGGELKVMSDPPGKGLKSSYGDFQKVVSTKNS